MKYTLEIENKKPIFVENFSVVERELKKLRSYGPRSFAILKNSNGEFVQIVGGRVTCVVEKGSKKNKKLYRARISDQKVPFVGEHILQFGGGQVKVEPNEFLFIEDVLEIFNSFYRDQEYPDRFSWRDISYLINE